jgi:hypothetical protein
MLSGKHKILPLKHFGNLQKYKPSFSLVLQDLMTLSRRTVFLKFRTILDGFCVFHSLTFVPLPQLIKQGRGKIGNTN